MADRVFYVPISLGSKTKRVVIPAVELVTESDNASISARVFLFGAATPSFRSALCSLLEGSSCCCWLGSSGRPELTVSSGG